MKQTSDSVPVRLYRDIFSNRIYYDIIFAAIFVHIGMLVGIGTIQLYTYFIHASVRKRFSF